MKKLVKSFLAVCLIGSMVACSNQAKPTPTPTPEVKDETTTTVVIGAGGAGMMTAIELKNGGQDVILIEKRAMVGGTTTLAATYFAAVGLEVQKAAGMDLSIDEYVEARVKENTEYDAENFKRLLENSQDSLDWLNERGANLTRSMSNYQVGIEDGSSLGVALVKILSEEIKKAEVDLRLETEALEILMEQGKAIGVKVKDAKGEYIIHAENVVLATGGFAANADMVNTYAEDWKGTPFTTANSSTGDGHLMAEAVGAQLTHMDSVRMNPSVYTDADGSSYSLSVARAEGGIMVNIEGKRFCNDYFPDYTQLSKWMMEQEGAQVFVVFDQKSVDTSVRLAGFKEKGYFLEASTLEELADLMGVPQENLKETVTRYQGFVDAKEDTDFGRKANMNTRIDQAPYYAVKIMPGIQVSLGGILTNQQFEVINADNQPIVGLYALGECADDGLFGAGPTNVNITFGRLLAQQLLNK